MGFFDWLNKSDNSNDAQELQVRRDSDFSNFNLVTQYIYEKSGITELDKRALTSSRLQQYAISEDVYTTDEFLNKMKQDHSFYQEILNIATVNETFFLREVKELEWLVSYIKNSNKKLKILSMPSSSGEETYSILLMLYRSGFDLNNIDISGFDINSEAIAHAKSGEYDTHSLHKIDEETKLECFDRVDNHYVIKKHFRDIAKFEQKNIFELDTNSQKYDVVLSRNMFIYFDEKKRQEATNIIVELLKPDAIFIKGHADQISEHQRLENIKYGTNASHHKDLENALERSNREHNK